MVFWIFGRRKSSRPIDIDVVHTGLRAKVVLSAFKSRTSSQLDGVVLRLSADAVIDNRSGQLHHQAHHQAGVAADASQLATLRDVHLLPGMTAGVLIAAFAPIPKLGSAIRLPSRSSSKFRASLPPKRIATRSINWRSRSRASIRWSGSSSVDARSAIRFR